ncbi:MAG: enoyl-CoA hydratase/isomerase family protein [Elusimicrobia bacterium]|nr:enoyl-CoA hydratase/isomerase family protein [Elusimicrobiota bacterium]
MIAIEDKDNVRTVTLNRPPSNGLCRELLQELESAARASAADPAVRCVVLRSALPKYFSSGLDPEQLLGPSGEPSPELFSTLFSTYRAWLELGKPTVASIDGYALLGGCIVAMMCDFRLMARETGRIALSEIRLGLSPTPLFLSRLLALGATPAAARQLALKGRTLKAEEALAAGLVDRVVDAASLSDETWAEARSLCRMPPQAYAAVKRDLALVAGPDFETLWRLSMDSFPRLMASPEAREALGALGERKRKETARGTASS